MEVSIEGLPESVRVPSLEVKVTDSAEFHPLRKICGRNPELTEEERISKGKLDARIKMYNRDVPELRLRIPDLHITLYLSLDLQVCADYYFKCQLARLEQDASNKVAELLTSFLEPHPLEWRICCWKNDLIAELVLGELNPSLGVTKEAGERWLKGYWKREQRMQRGLDTYVSPKRMAASSAVLELEMLQLIDKNPLLWIRPGFRVYAAFVKWLNRNWTRIAAKEKGAALLKRVVSQYHNVELRDEGQDVALTDSELCEICNVYRNIESLHDPGNVPPYQVVLNLVARKHWVSPRLMTQVRAENHKRQSVFRAHRKARL
jgi:hypothetical protein